MCVFLDPSLCFWSRAHACVFVAVEVSVCHLVYAWVGDCVCFPLKIRGFSIIGYLYSVNGP